MTTDATSPFVDANDPTNAECQHVLDRVYEFLDNEVDTATGDEIRAHLTECEPCLDRFDVEWQQGFLFGRPRPREETTAWLLDHR